MCIMINQTVWVPLQMMPWIFIYYQRCDKINSPGCSRDLVSLKGGFWHSVARNVYLLSVIPKFAKVIYHESKVSWLYSHNKELWEEYINYYSIKVGQTICWCLLIRRWRLFWTQTDTVHCDEHHLIISNFELCVWKLKLRKRKFKCYAPVSLIWWQTKLLRLSWNSRQIQYISHIHMEKSPWKILERGTLFKEEVTEQPSVYHIQSGPISLFFPASWTRLLVLQLEVFYWCQAWH